MGIELRKFALVVCVARRNPAKESSGYQFEYACGQSFATLLFFIVLHSFNQPNLFVDYYSGSWVWKSLDYSIVILAIPWQLLIDPSVVLVAQQGLLFKLPVN